MGEVGSRRNLAAALVLLVAAACSQSGDERGPTATVPPAATTTRPADPYAVPEVIDAAYVNRVLAGLDAVMGDVVRLVVKTKTLPPEAYDRLRAIYGDDELLQREIDGFQDDLEGGLRGYHAEPGPKRTTVQQLLTATPSCVFARVSRDYSAVGVGANPQLLNQWIGLRRLDESRDSHRHNPTKWAFIAEGFRADLSALPNPCGRA